MSEKPKWYKMDEMPKGHKVFVECPRTGGGVSFWLGRIAFVTPQEVNIYNSCWVADTGERYKFEAGEFDSNCHIHPRPVDALKRLPRWGAIVDDWIHPIPDKPVGV